MSAKDCIFCKMVAGQIPVARIYEDDKPVSKGTIIGKLFSELGPRYLDRPGGYTRIVRLSLRRLGDNGRLALLQLVGKEETAKKEAKVAKKKRSRKKTKQPVAAKEDAETKSDAETSQE